MRNSRPYPHLLSDPGMALEDFYFIPLTADYEIKPFKCKDEDLNGFLFDDARKYLADLMAVTYLWEDLANGKTVAYFSLLNDKITFDPEQRTVWNRLSRRVANPKRRKDYPAVKIGRLAVSEEYAGQSIGRDLIRLIKYVFTHGNRTGYRFITVDAYQDAVGFYRQCGFDFLSTTDEKDKTRSMYYDLKRFMDDKK